MYRVEKHRVGKNCKEYNKEQVIIHTCCAASNYSYNLRVMHILTIIIKKDTISG